MFLHKEGNDFSIVLTTTVAKRDEDGKVITMPRGFYTRPHRRGKINSVYFDKNPDYVTIGK